MVSSKENDGTAQKGQRYWQSILDSPGHNWPNLSYLGSEEVSFLATARVCMEMTWWSPPDVWLAAARQVSEKAQI
jgi:hypothetical protein